MRRNRNALLSCLILAGMCTACGGGSSATSTQPPLTMGTTNIAFQRSDYSVPSGVIATGDFNQDGQPDLMVANTVVTLLTNSHGKFTASTVPASPEFYLGSLAVGDVNHDGMPDFISSTGVDKGFSYTFLNDGGSTFQMLGAGIFGASIVQTSLADLNNDGKLDWLSSSSLEGLSVWFGNGDGTFNYTGCNVLAFDVEC